MSTGTDTLRENLTLTEADLAACQPLAGEGGHVLRALGFPEELEKFWALAYSPG